MLDHRAPDYLDQLRALTDGRGVDLILEMLANVNLGKDLTVLAQGGRVVVIGSRGPVEINARDAMGRDASILGMILGNISERERAQIHAALRAARHAIGNEESRNFLLFSGNQPGTSAIHFLVPLFASARSPRTFAILGTVLVAVPDLFLGSSELFRIR